MDKKIEWTEEKPISKWIKFGVPVAIFILWLCAPLIAWGLHSLFGPHGLSEEIPHDFATFGDTFGVINSLFSGGALFAVFYAILLQSKELRLQRLDLRITMDEVRGQKEALLEQSKTMKQQSFDSVFFQLLRTQHEITSVMVFARDEKEYRDKVAFQLYHETLRQLYSRASGSSGEMPPLDSYYDQFWEMYGSNLQHSYGNLRTILEFLVEARGFDIHMDKDFYARTVSLQLSEHELALLHYHCAWKTKDPLSKLVKRFGILRKLPDKLYFHPSHSGDPFA